MNLHQIIAELRSELAAINEVLSVLDGLARVQGKRKGRPPLLWVHDIEASAAPKGRGFSDETRKKMADAQRKRWAKIRKKQLPGKGN